MIVALVVLALVAVGLGVLVYLQGRQMGRERALTARENTRERELLLNRIANPRIVQLADEAQLEGPEPYSEDLEVRAVLNGETPAYLAGDEE